MTEYEIKLIKVIEQIGKRLENITEELVKIEESIRDTSRG